MSSQGLKIARVSYTGGNRPAKDVLCTIGMMCPAGEIEVVTSSDAIAAHMAMTHQKTGSIIQADLAQRRRIVGPALTAIVASGCAEVSTLPGQKIRVRLREDAPKHPSLRSKARGAT